MFATESHSICVNVNYLFSAEILHKGASITSSRLVHTRSERHTDFYTNTCVEKTQAISHCKEPDIYGLPKTYLHKKDPISY